MSLMNFVFLSNVNASFYRLLQLVLIFFSAREHKPFFLFFFFLFLFCDRACFCQTRTNCFLNNFCLVTNYCKFASQNPHLQDKMLFRFPVLARFCKSNYYELNHNGKLLYIFNPIQEIPKM